MFTFFKGQKIFFSKSDPNMVYGLSSFFKIGRGGGVKPEMTNVRLCLCMTRSGSVTEDGVERALTGAGAGVTRGARATDAARALLRVSGGLGGAGTLGCCCGGPGGNGTRGCCVM